MVLRKVSNSIRKMKLMEI